MLSNETVSKLYEMHMGTMAAAFSAQLADAQFHELSFEERFSMLVDTEWSSRKSNHLQRLIRNAGYSIPGASIEDISYSPERQLDKVQILRLASCAYIEEAHNVIILGATGTGKTYLACALGSAANRSFYATKYVRLPDLLVEIALARGDGTYRDLMRKYKKIKLLILDEWLLYPLKESEARDLLELVEARCKVASTIFCSQFDVPGWHESLFDPTLADAICDRIIYNSHTVTIKGESMRKLSAITD
jgi:DNA replication protein DnaC